MIGAAKGGPLGWLLDGYVGWKFRSTFRGLWVRGALPTGAEGRLVYVNHTSWWDGFVLHQLSRAAGWDAYCLMEEKNLARYRFLSRLGAFSIRPGEAASSLESLRYARELLSRPRAAVCLFPEGELRPFGVLPLKLRRGVELLARVGRAECVPVALRYAFFEHERPDVLVEVGAPHAPGELELFQDNLEAVVRKVAAATSLEGFTRRVSGGSGVAERWDTVRGIRA
ncbi:lysophospholipid acyltransferase family protein [Hyalangium rubrum]|uniref:Lysophospholipid acyltransferase family protein n=1 Tax=Hyalangium rubrum TaxID=3103134 RepID=A0ABU5HHG4_9BACT|nr:lysophospholipid acyltransferase family protein [Hyalangium sp. s54d21]MDY7232796.1 lysophospholipid acyltransferase family protein [Hyalangium sp. s54d21]